MRERSIIGWMSFLMLAGIVGPVLAESGLGDQIISIASVQNEILDKIAPNSRRANTTPHVSLDGCVLTILDADAKDRFGRISVLNLAALDLTDAFVLSSGRGYARISLDISDETLLEMSPALWRYMGREDAERSPAIEIVSRFQGYDQLGMGEYNDPSMISYSTQQELDALWEAAVRGEGGEILKENWWGWYGPTRFSWRPLVKTPGGKWQVFVVEDEAEEFLNLISTYVEQTCPAS